MPTGDPVLRKAVADLIEPRTVRFVQRPRGGGWRVAEVVHEPLIQVIRKAIAGNTGSKAGGASDPTTRMPIDPGALAVYDDLVRETTRWYQGLANRPAPELPEVALLDWLELFEHSLVHPEDDAAAAAEVARKVRKLLWWERRILDQFDPPEQFEVAAVVDEPVISRHRLRVGGGGLSEVRARDRMGSVDGQHDQCARHHVPAVGSGARHDRGCGALSLVRMDVARGIATSGNACGYRRTGGQTRRVSGEV